jgi:misacylated tRNA(Ala) deacylase
MIGIGEGAERVDWQPCGGTHVARTGEIGTVRLGKIEKKGKTNRRVQILLAE